MKFNQTLEAVNVMVMASYPAARFYEAQGILSEVDSILIPEVSNMVIVYSLPLGKTLTVNVNPGKEYEFKLINENWLEDRFMTPYVGMSMEDAFEIIIKKQGGVLSKHVVLRHPLDPWHTRPVYIFGDNKIGGYSVDVFNGEVTKE